MQAASTKGATEKQILEIAAQAEGIKAQMFASAVDAVLSENGSPASTLERVPLADETQLRAKAIQTWLDNNKYQTIGDEIQFGLVMDDIQGIEKGRLENL